MAMCLNCGAQLQGRFCAGCGQRAVPPYPTVREMAADAWHEFSGWDGRFVRTFRTLARPGALTIDVLEGRRARYVSPLRLYLAASVFYFLSAALIPSLRAEFVLTLPGPDRATIDLSRPVPPEQREAVERAMARSPRWFRPLVQPMLDDPSRQRGKFLERYSHAQFALVPVLAAILALFYRRRPFSQHLVFSLHVNSANFLAMALAQFANLTGHLRTANAATLVAMAAVAVYALNSFRVVYRESWLRVFAKAVGIGFVYVLALTVAVVITFVWTALM